MYFRLFAEHVFFFVFWYPQSQKFDTHMPLVRVVTPQEKVSAGKSLRVYGVLELTLWCHVRPVFTVPVKLYLIIV